MTIFQSPLFWSILEKSGSLGPDRGVLQHTFTTASGGALHCFTKSHSYGEYIFDWSWAQAYERQSIPYYPKLLSMVPFTPVTTPHFWGPKSAWPALLQQHNELLPHHSSSHFLFTTPEEQQFLGEEGFLHRDSFQYHFFNDGYLSFEDFLGRLKSRKAKHIRQERVFESLRIERLTGVALRPEHAEEMIGFYHQTLDEKGAIPYLSEDFFRQVFTQMPENVLYVRASQAERAVAGALFFYDEERLYGRYWGAHALIQNLHFELCYYQGIEFCIERKLEVFEAGAQGEHKIGRGFRPVLISSAHLIRHAGFAKAIDNYIQQEKLQVAATMAELAKLLPFRND